VITRLRPIALVVLALASVAFLSGCGRRGALEPPPKTPEAAPEGQIVPGPTTAPTTPKRNDRFILDPLLD
jgi:predicted small lipoprotein YifL